MHIKKAVEYAMKYNTAVLEYRLHIFKGKRKYHLINNCRTEKGTPASTTVENFLKDECGTCSHIAYVKNSALPTEQRKDNEVLAQLFRHASQLQRIEQRTQETGEEVTLEDIQDTASDLHSLQNMEICADLQQSKQNAEKLLEEYLNWQLQFVRDAKLSQKLVKEINKWDDNLGDTMIALPRWWADGVTRGRRAQAAQLFLEHLDLSYPGYNIARVPGPVASFIFVHTQSPNLELATDTTLTATQKEIFMGLWPDMALADALDAAKILS